MKRILAVLAVCFVIVMTAVWTADAYVPVIDGPAQPGPSGTYAQAQRLTPPPPTTTPVEPPTGLWGQPFAPEGLTDCAEMTFYRQQWGLPARFDDIGWRESNCRNEDGVHTSCCWGYWQLWTSLHLQDHRLVDKMHACGVWSHWDLNSDVPIEKQRQACAAKALFDVVGYSAW